VTNIVDTMTHTSGKEESVLRSRRSCVIIDAVRRGPSSMTNDRAAPKRATLSPDVIQPVSNTAAPRGGEASTGQGIVITVSTFHEINAHPKSSANTAS